MSADPRPGKVPAEVLTFLLERGARGSFSHFDTWREEHAAAFAVAKATELDIVEAIKGQVVRAVQEGLPFEAFRKNLTPILADAGWWGRKDQVDPLTGEVKEVQLGSPARLRTIYHTNVRTARAAGQWARIEKAKKALPFVRYRHGNPSRPRDQHVAWDGRVVPVDSPWLDYAAPQNGYGCTCWLEQISASAAKASGVTPDDEIDMEPIEVRNERTGVVTTTIRGVDPSFAYNPGKDRFGGLRRAGIIGGAAPAPAKAKRTRKPKPAPAPKPAPEWPAGLQATPAPAPPSNRRAAPLAADVIDQLSTLARDHGLAAAQTKIHDLLGAYLRPGTPRGYTPGGVAVLPDAPFNGVNRSGRVTLNKDTADRVLAGRPSPLTQAEVTAHSSVAAAQAAWEAAALAGAPAATVAELHAAWMRASHAAEPHAKRVADVAGYQDAIRTMIHEEIHSYGPVSTGALFYRAFDATIEEATTELLARAVAGGAHVVHVRETGAYSTQIDHLVDVIKASRPDTDDALAYDIAIDAAAEWKAQSAPPAAYEGGSPNGFAGLREILKKHTTDHTALDAGLKALPRLL